MAEKKSTATFETALRRLEEIVKQLENGNLSLEAALKLFEEGIELSAQCQKQLEEAERRVEILLKKAQGKITAEPFQLADEEADEDKS